MKVKELIESLKKLDPELEVILQRDPEGNGYSPLNDVDGEDVFFGQVDGGMVLSAQDLAEEIENGYLDEDDGTFEPCVVLFPMY